MKLNGCPMTCRVNCDRLRFLQRFNVMKFSLAAVQSTFSFEKNDSVGSLLRMDLKSSEHYKTHRAGPCGRPQGASGDEGTSRVLSCASALHWKAVRCESVHSASEPVLRKSPRSSACGALKTSSPYGVTNPRGQFFR